MSDNVRTYEGMFLLDAGNADFHAASEPARAMLERCQAEVLTMKPWDERRLAYEIRGRRRGLYVLAYFKADPERIAELERDCQLDERILRLLVLRRDNLTDEQVAEDTPAVASARRAAARKAEEDAAAEASAGAEAEKTPAAETSAGAEADKTPAAETPAPAEADKTPAAETPAPAEADKAPEAETPAPAEADKTPEAETPAPAEADKTPEAETPAPAEDAADAAPAEPRPEKS